MMDRLFPGGPTRSPPDRVVDHAGPIMAVASITTAPQPRFEATSLPVSRIAIELDPPITGGLFLGGRFAPEGVQVRGMNDDTPAGG